LSGSLLNAEGMERVNHQNSFTDRIRSLMELYTSFHRQEILDYTYESSVKDNSET